MHTLMCNKSKVKVLEVNGITEWPMIFVHTWDHLQLHTHTVAVVSSSFYVFEHHQDKWTLYCPFNKNCLSAENTLSHSLRLPGFGALLYQQRTELNLILSKTLNAEILTAFSDLKEEKVKENKPKIHFHSFSKMFSNSFEFRNSHARCHKKQSLI